MRALIDTCVIIDALQNREPFCESAKNILLAVANKQLDGYISANSITDIYYITRRSTHNAEQTKHILGTLLSLFNVLDTTALDCRKALSSKISDYEDAVMCETAERCDMDCIVTRNHKDYEKASIKIFKPDEILKELKDLNNFDI